MSVCNVEKTCSSNGPNVKDIIDGFGPPLFHTTIPRKKKPSMPKTQGKGSHIARGPVLAAHPALCQVPFQSIKEDEWTEMHEKLKEGTQRSGGKKAGQRVAWRRTSTESFFTPKIERERAFNRRSAFRESHLSIWRVDVYQALRIREDRVEVVASDASYVSWDRG